MARTHKIVHVEPGSELARFLEEIDHSALVVMGDQRFTVKREEARGDAARGVDSEHPFGQYDPVRARAVIASATGVLAGIDVDALKRQIRGDEALDDAESG